jgi:hypothetical protein
MHHPDPDVPLCPAYTFFDVTFELCPIADLFAVLKYPLWIGIAIQAWRNL